MMSKCFNVEQGDCGCQKDLLAIKVLVVYVSATHGRLASHHAVIATGYMYLAARRPTRDRKPS